MTGQKEIPRQKDANDGSGPRLVAVYVEADRLTELQEVLLQLDIPILLAPGSTPEEPKVRFDSAGVEELTATLSTLSTSDDFDKKTLPADLFPPRSLSTTNIPSSTCVSPGKKRYYSITVGKCTGVYWDTWDNVETLIKHVPNARYKGFSTHAAAAEHYFEAKKALKVKIVRDPGDENKFGSIGSATQ